MAGCVLVLLGMAIGFGRTEQIFDIRTRRWRTRWQCLGLQGGREGSLDDLVAVHLRLRRAHAHGAAQDLDHPVTVGMKDGTELLIQHSSSHGAGLAVAKGLSAALDIPLVDHENEPSVVMESPPAGLAQPPARLFSYRVAGGSVTFTLRPGTRGEAAGCIAVLLGIAAAAACAAYFMAAYAGQGARAPFVFTALVAAPFVLFLAYAALKIFVPPQQNLWVSSGSGRWPRAW